MSDHTSQPMKQSFGLLANIIGGDNFSFGSREASPRSINCSTVDKTPLSTTTPGITTTTNIELEHSNMLKLLKADGFEVQEQLLRTPTSIIVRATLTAAADNNNNQLYQQLMMTTNNKEKKNNTNSIDKCNVHQQPTVMIKFHALEKPTTAHVTKYLKDFEIGRKLSHQTNPDHSNTNGMKIVDESHHIIQYYQLAKYGHCMAIVMEDFNAIGLDEYMKRRQQQKQQQQPFNHTINNVKNQINNKNHHHHHRYRSHEVTENNDQTLSNLIDIAIQLTRGLSTVHQHGIIHGGLSSTNVLISSNTSEDGHSSDKVIVKISDFGYSSELTKEHVSLAYFESLKASLAYISPEQTGRMNRDVDCRSDLYSLGVILYELFTGRLPFTSNDPLDLIYSHMAVKPVPMHDLLPGDKIPVPLSNIVMRLLEKNSEDRYQSAFGVENDLRHCLDLLNNSGKIESFKLAQKDVSSHFHVHQELYGREGEVRRLQSAFGQVCDGRVSNMMVLVRGYSGIGKTRLINEVHKPLTRHRGYFISGKFDQFKKNIPYASFIQAFQQLVFQLLTESESRIEYWRRKLLDALSGKGQVIIDVIPHVEHIIGPQTAVPEMGAIETQNRFNAVFQSFIRVFADRNHPLVIFLDDLQWADTASNSMIELLMTEPENEFLLLIGAYRDNEVNESHPLTHLLGRIEAKRSIEDIVLGPLQLEDVNQMISNTLCCLPEHSLSLAQIIMQKTKGNPFFVIQMLLELANKKLIEFNFDLGEWTWNMLKIEQLDISPNVVDMMTSRIQQLPKDTQSILAIAASIGNVFTLRLLALVYGSSVAHTYSLLWHAIKSELMIQLGNEFKWNWSSAYKENIDEIIIDYEFKFLHDKVQQAAYQLEDKEHQMKIHLRIARLLLQNTQKAELDEKLFDIIGQYRFASGLLTNPEEKDQLIQLTIQGAQKAKLSAAYETACSYLCLGESLLPENPWENYYEDAFRLYKLLAECEYLQFNFSRAEALYKLLVDHAKTDLEKISVYFIQANQYETEMRFDDVVKTMLHCLTMLGITFPDDKEQLSQMLKEELAEVRVNLGDRSIESLIDQPLMTDTAHKSAIHIMINMWTSCYAIGQRDLLVTLTIKMCNFCLKHGQCEVTGAAYVFYSFVIGFLINDYTHALAFGNLGIEMSHLYDSLQPLSRAYFIYGCGTSVWKRSLKECIPYLQKCFETCFDAGDLAISGHTAQYIGSYYFFSGYDLAAVARVHDKYLKNYLKKANYWLYTFSMFSTTLYRFLIGDESYSEDDEVKEHKEPVLLAAYYFGKVQKSYWMKDTENWLSYVEAGYQLCEDGLYGIFLLVEMNFHACLIYLASMKTFNEDEKLLYMKKIEMMLDKLRNWAQNCPENVLHKVYIVEAELARYYGKHMKATDFYELAIESAQSAGFTQYEALANELCAEMLFARGKSRYAKTHILDALYLYQRYGANARVDLLRRQYSSLLVGSPEFDINSEIPEYPDSQIDLITLVRASKALSSEMTLQEFMENMMNLVITNSGAKRGIFLRAEPDNTLLVLAESSNDETQVEALRAIPLDTWHNRQISKHIINFVCRTKQRVKIDDCADDHPFIQDPYLQETDVKSVLVIPIIKQNDFKGILYLESSLTNAFTDRQVEFLSSLASQMIIQLENAKFADVLESEKRYRALASELEIVKKRLEEFIDVLCHELRNPLNGLFGSKMAMMDLLEKTSHFFAETNFEVQPDEESKKQQIREYLHEFEELVTEFTICSDHLYDIVNTVLTLSVLENRGVKLQCVPFNVKETVEQVAIMHRAKLSMKNLKLMVNYVGDDLVVFGDPYRLKEILINLVSNAVKFTDDGYIKISCTCVSRNETCTTYDFEVEDSGIGLTPEEKTKLFKAFSQANSETYWKYGGAGLGLKITADIIELMGSSISLDSKKDEGSRFTFTLTFLNQPPQIEDTTTEGGQLDNFAPERVPTPAVDGAHNNCQSTSNMKPHILIAEDNMINSKLLRGLLSKAGYTCETAANGREAVDRYTEPDGAPIDCILMDLEMPTMGGIEATNKIRAIEEENNFSPVVIIGVSANARDKAVENALNNGMQGFVTKPYHPKDIFAAIDKFFPS